ncbi:MAG: protein-export rane protein SecD, preprotein translocase subunit SecD [Candidatus Kaiserbacteria bacterium]|nr:protein-export rane protein SecD, preprotein translocase subunit SecD [Candidatus Kaiserbacteria bacterium]
MWKQRFFALLLLVVGLGLGYLVYHNQTTGAKTFGLGLDLSGGTQLVYKADISGIPSADVADSMAALRDTIERRVNLFGVSEPIVQTEVGGTLTGNPEQRLIVELPGVTDTERAVALIGQTPVLEFRLRKLDASTSTSATINDVFEPATITGKDVKTAQLVFSQSSATMSEPQVELTFTSEGAQKFADLTGKNVGRVFGIFLDGQPISQPVIREAIPSGTAVISGAFTADGAKELARNLNYGALPLPIEIIGTQTVSSTLGDLAVRAGLYAGLLSVLVVMLFMIIWYRIPGLMASLALAIYIAFMLALFMYIPVTLTAAGIAGFILSIGMAVDANVLIFARMREEMKSGKTAAVAISDGFARAWPSIRDSNTSSIITAVILFWFGTSLIKGFALVFGLGVLVSMLTAIGVSRTFLRAVGARGNNSFIRFFFGSGVTF